MKRQNSFSESVHDLMDAWIASADGAAARDIHEVISKTIRPNMVLAVIDTSAEDAMDFVIDFVHRYQIATDVQVVPELQTRCMFRDFRDQEFLRQHLIPACEEVLQQQPGFFASVDDCRWIADRLRVPAASTKMQRWPQFMVHQFRGYQISSAAVSETPEFR